MQALVDTLKTAQLRLLQPFIFSASFMTALQPPSLRQLNKNCHDVSLPFPMPAPGLRRPKGLCPPPEPRVHAIILHTHATHATACRIWAKCTCSSDLCAAFAVLGEEEDADYDAAPMTGVEAAAAAGAAAPAQQAQENWGVKDDTVSWVDIIDSVKSCVTMSQACMDSMLEHAAHLESTGSHCDSVCGSSGDLGSDLDRHTVQKLLDSSQGIATAGARAVFESVTRLVDSGCSSQVAYVSDSSQETSSEHPPDTLLYRVLVVACDAVTNMYDTARREASLVQQHVAFKDGKSLARPRDVGTLIRGSSRNHKGLQTLNELLWKRVEFPEEQGASDSSNNSQQKRSGGTSRVIEGDGCIGGAAVGGSAPQKRARDGSQVVADVGAEMAVGGETADELERAQVRCGGLAESAAAAAAGGVAPPTAAAQAVRAVVWQRLLVATEALVLLRRLALMKSSTVPWRKQLGQHVLRTMLYNSHCLHRLEGVIQRVVAMEQWPPFTYAPVDTGEPWAAPVYSPWACAFLSQHDRHVMHGRVGVNVHERCNMEDLTKAAMFWRKQLLHNRPEVYGGKSLRHR